MKKSVCSLFIAVILLVCCCVPTFAKQIPSERLLPRLTDNLNLLSESGQSELLSKLDEISERQQLDVVITTTDDLGGYSTTEYADDYFDYNGFGFGSSHDGILLLIYINGDTRNWRISTTGYGITVFTDAGQKYMADQFTPYLSDNDFDQAFNKFADLCDEFITQAKTDKPYDSGNLPKTPLPIYWIPLALAIGLAISVLITGIMKSSLKTVRMQAAAGSYVKQNSLNITESRDTFLYTHVSRRAKPKNNGSSGSSTHTSSSGRSHGGSGGSF